MRRRSGFTILEIAIASAVLAVVIAAVMSSFMGMRKAQNSSLAFSKLQMAGSKALRDMYLELSQAKAILASESPTSTVTSSYFWRMALLPAPAPQPIPTGNFDYPLIRSEGGLGVRGTAAGQLDPGSVGNMLLFVTSSTPYVVTTPGVKLPGPPAFEIAERPYTLPTQRIVAYFLVEKPLTGSTIRGGRNYTYQLCRWESKRYLEKSDLEAFIKLLDITTDTAALRNALVTEFGNNSVWDSRNADAATAFYDIPTMTVAGPLLSPSFAAVTNPTLARETQTYLINTLADSEALTLVSFNTQPAVPDYRVPGLAVPLYADVVASAAEVPYGLEVAISGPIGARALLLRIALAARIHGSANTFVSAPQQEVVKVMDLGNY